MNVHVLNISTDADFHLIILFMIQSTKKYSLSLKWSRNDIKMNTEKAVIALQTTMKIKVQAFGKIC